MNETWLRQSSNHPWSWFGNIEGMFIAIEVHDKVSRAAIYTKRESYQREDIIHLERNSLARLVAHIEGIYSTKLCFHHAKPEFLARAHPPIVEKNRFDPKDDVPASPSRRRMKANLLAQSTIHEQLGLAI